MYIVGVSQKRNADIRNTDYGINNLLKLTLDIVSFQVKLTLSEIITNNVMLLQNYY